ncbi:MAG: tRNA pseudouridine(55) synthase TruB [Pseudomonadales bacterium]|jgi:tRNA pseudouridine55 synthase|nr:tRNA pseudouridine(55) synthase TruB [Pseudomonadales bacterium]
MARGRRRGRELDGILLLDKAQGLSSNAALQEVKRLFGAAKAGHTGSLDPLATGVLPICFGEATKFSQFLLNSDKRYLTRIRLGVRTDSGDAEGEVVETRPVPALTEAEVERALEGFRGVIEQIPSMYSAIKHQGQPLYKLARQGIEVERAAREVEIYENRLEALRGEELELFVHCSKGTYVRTLAEDLGEVLGCGAHVTALRRLSVGPFRIEDAITMAALEALRQQGGHAALDRLLRGVETAVEQWPEVCLTDATAYYLIKGQPVMVPHAPTTGWVRIREQCEAGDRFLGVGEVLDDGRIAPRRLVVGK